MYANFLALGLRLRPSTTIAAAALKLATDHNHPISDMVYIALAEQSACKFVTADEKLMKKFSATFACMSWLSDI